MNAIHIETTILKPVAKVWEYFTQPKHITQWNFAHESWTCPNAINNLQIGGEFNFRMEAKDKSFGFDFKGTYDEIIPFKKIKYHLENGRNVDVLFEKIDENTTKITEIFEPDSAQPEQMQKDGWYAILENFRIHVEDK